MMEFGRRGTDKGKEDPYTIWARIDERLKNHLDDYREFKDDYKEHKEDDRKNFAFLNKTVWFGMGAIAVIQILMRVYK